MLSIQCPFCGPRDETEFRYGGQAHLARPAAPADIPHEVWSAYLFTRVNPKGMARERWVHWAGCRQWFNMARDTRTHAVVAVYPMGEPGPEPREGASQ